MKDAHDRCGRCRCKAVVTNIVRVTRLMSVFNCSITQYHTTARVPHVPRVPRVQLEPICSYQLQQREVTGKPHRANVSVCAGAV